MIELADILQSMSVMFACWSVVAGIYAWRREFLGKRRIELAEETLEAFFAVRDAIAHIRTPISNTNEGSSRKKRDNETVEETEILNRAYTVFERHQAEEKVFIRFATLQYRFMAAFGKETEEIFTKVNRTVNRIFRAAQMLETYYWKSPPVKMEGNKLSKHLDNMRREENIIWDYYNEADEIKAGLNAVLADLERVTAPAFYGVLRRRLFRK